MLSTAYKRENRVNTVINPNHQPEMTSRYSFSNYVKAGLAIAGTIGTVALAKTTGFMPSFSWGGDGEPLDNPHQLINPQETISFADNSLPVQPRHAKRAFGSEFQINTYITYSQSSPSVAILNSDDFVVVWHSSNGQDGDWYGIYGQRFSSIGVLQGGEFQINTYTIESQSSPSITALTTGDFVVAWNSFGQDGDGAGVYGQRYSSTGTPRGGEFQINTYTTSHQRFPSIAALTSGDFVVVWASWMQDGSWAGIYGRQFSSTGPQGSEFQINTYTTGSQAYPSVAALTTGDFVVVWQSNGQDCPCGVNMAYVYGIYGQRYSSAGVPQGSEFQINTYTTDSQESPSIAALTTGDFVVVWQSNLQDGDRSGIYGQRFSNVGVPQGSEFQINTYTTNDQQFPSVAALTTGDFVVTWNSFGQDGDRNGIYGQSYSSTGVPQSSEFQINTYTTLDQRSPSIAALRMGAFVVTWESWGSGSDYTRDYSGDGIYGRIYYNEAPSLTSNILTVNEGQSVILTTSNLSAADENINSALTFTVSNVQYGQFERVSNPGVAITRFTQQEVIDGAIQFVHDGSENQPYYDVTVSDGALTDGPAAANIIFTNINDAPSLVNNPFILQKGETITVTPSILNAIDSDNSSLELLFNITKNNNGYFHIATNNTMVTQFTLQQIIDHKIMFLSDGTALPKYTLYVTDGELTSASEISSIVYIAQNQLVTKPGDAFVLSQKQLTIQSQILSTMLEISLSNIQYGRFEKNVDPGIAIFSFTLSDLNARAIRFIHSGTEHVPQFTLHFKDVMINYTLPRTVAGNIILNHPPIVSNPTGALNWALNTFSNYAIPNTTFNDPDVGLLQLSVVELNDAPLPAWVRFDNVTNTLAGTPALSGLYDFKIIATDSYDESVDDRFYIDVKATNGTTIINEGTNPLLIVGAVAGGTVLLVGSLAVGFFYNKKVQDRKTRQQHKFAQLIRHHLKLDKVDNFESEDGKRYVAAVQSLSNLLYNDQGIDIANMSDNRLNELAGDIALSAKNKITPATAGLWKKSKISIAEFEENLKAIVSDVNRRQTNFDDHTADDNYIELDALSMT